MKRLCLILTVVLWELGTVPGAAEPVAVRGSIVDPDGRPVRGAAVELVPLPSRSAGRELRLQGKTPEPVARTASGPEGRFAVIAPASGMWDVKVNARGFLPCQISLIPLLEPRELLVKLEAGAPRAAAPVDAGAVPSKPAASPVRVSGLVLEEGTRKPLPEALVWPADDPGAFVRADAEGAYEIPWSGDGIDRWSAAARGYVAVLDQPRRDGVGPAFLLKKSVPLRGTVVDPRDRPIAGARVRTEGMAAGPSGRDERHALTREDGSFSIAGLAPGERVLLYVTRKGYAPADVQDIQMPPMQTAKPLRIVLRPAARVAGRVVDEAGEPVADAHVSLSEVGAQSVAGGSLLIGRAGKAYTGDDGRFAVEGVEAGRLRLTVQATGFLEGELPPFEVAPGHDAEDLEVVLRRGAVVAGRVTGPDGEPVANARVQPAEADPDFEAAFTDASGRYRLVGVDEGARSFAATAQGFQRAVKDLEVRSGENRLDFRMEGGHEISGRVLDTGGAPVAGATVRLLSPNFISLMPGASPDSAETGADGSFRIEDVQTGIYGLEARKTGYARGRLASVDVAGPLQGLELRLEAEAGVHGRLVGIGPEHWPLVRVFARLTAGGAPEVTGGKPDFRGGYRIRGLAAGEWQVSGEAPGGLRARGTVTVTPGADAVLDLEFSGGLTLTGRVLRGGQPIGKAEVIAVSLGDSIGLSGGDTDPQGAFRILGLAPGSYHLIVRSGDLGINHRETLELSADRDILVDIAGQRVTGQVVDAADRSPLDKAVVLLEPLQAEPFQFLSRRSTASDADGTFILTDVAPGAYRLKASLEGYATADATVQVGDAGTEAVVLALQPTEGLTVEVLGALGSPPPYIHAALIDATGRTFVSGYLATGENGRVRLASAPPGRWQLLVSGTGYATVEQAVQVPGPTARLVLPPATALTVEAPGLPDGAVVTVTGAGGRPFRWLGWSSVRQEWPLGGGQAVIEGLPEGRWQVRVTTPDGQTLEAAATTAPGHPARVVVR